MNVDTPPLQDAPVDARTSIARTLRVGLIIVGIVVLLWLLSSIVLLIFTATLFAVLLRGAARLLTRWTKLPVGLSLTIVTLLIAVAVAAFAYWVGPRFVHEGKQLVGDVSGYVQQLRHRYGNNGWVKMAEHSFASQKGTSVGPSAAKLLKVTFGTLTGFILMIFTALYLAAAPQPYMSGTIRLMPLWYRKRAFDILNELGHVLRYWMLGQLIDMAVVGALATTGLFLLHVPLPIALGVLAGTLTFVPYLGAIMAGIPAVIVALTVGPTTVLWVIVLYLICHTVEGYIIAPLVMRRTVHLPPALTVLSMTILGVIYGLFGVLIATPLTAAVMVIIREIYVADMLGDRHSHDGSLVVMRKHAGPKFFPLNRQNRQG
jgi:predicted PurR-regulated permease PerM